MNKLRFNILASISLLEATVFNKEFYQFVFEIAVQYSLPRPRGVRNKDLKLFETSVKNWVHYESKSETPLYQENMPTEISCFTPNILVLIACSPKL